jgi:hypothetical protein
VQVRPPKDGGRLSVWSLSDSVYMGQRGVKFTMPVSPESLELLKALAAQVPVMFEAFNPQLAADSKTGLITEKSREKWIDNHQPFAKDPSPSNVKKGVDGKFLTPFHMNLKDGETMVKYHAPSFRMVVEVQTDKNDRKALVQDIPGRVIPTSMFLERKIVVKNGKRCVEQVNVPVADMWNPSKEPDPLTGARWDLSGFRVVSAYFRMSPYLTGKFGFSPKLHSVLLERAPISGNDPIPFLEQDDSDAAWLAAQLVDQPSAPPTDEEMMAALAEHEVVSADVGMKRKRDDEADGGDDGDDTDQGEI